MQPSDAQPSLSLGSPREFRTRFLYPFFYEGTAEEAATDLCAASVGGAERLWQREAPRVYYRDELTAQIKDTLFPGGKGPDEPGPGLLRADPKRVQRWFQGARAEAGKRSVPVRLDPRCGIELFLSDFGTGVLSIMLDSTGPDAGTAALLRFNYFIAQLARHPTAEAVIRIPHPIENPEAWARIPAVQREKLEKELAEELDPSAPVSERLGKRRARVSFLELISELLAPISQRRLRPMQDVLSVYTGVRFGEGVDFSNPEVRSAAAPLLSGLGQVEEPAHAGEAGSDPRVPSGLLNRRHWAAVSLHGAAHIVADQAVLQEAGATDAITAEHGFNEQRLHRVMEKYFVPYLVALLQRMVLKRESEQASRLLSTCERESDEAAFSALRESILIFSARGYLPEVSLRAALHAYYRLCQEGLDITRNLVEVRETIGQLDSFYEARRQARSAQVQATMLEKTSETLKGTQKMQAAIEWIEVFLVSVYAAHLYHMLAPVSTEPHWHVGVGISALLGGVSAMLVLRPWHHAH